MDSFDPGPGSERTVGQEIVAGDDRVGRADRLREAPGPPAALRTALVVRITEQDGVVEIEDEVPRVSAQMHAIASLARVCAAGSPRRTATPGGAARAEEAPLDRSLRSVKDQPAS